MRKYKIEIILGIILIISCVVFAVNIFNKNDNESTNVENAITKDDNGVDNLFSVIKEISKDVFKEYFYKNVGEEVIYMNSLHVKNKSDQETGKETVKEHLIVNSVSECDSFDGKNAESGYVYLKVNVSMKNEYDYDRIASFGANVYFWNDFDDFNYNSSNKKFNQYKLEFDSNQELYTTYMDFKTNSSYYVKTDEESNAFLLRANETVTFNAIYYIEKDILGTQCVLYNMSSQKHKWNSDYMIKLYNDKL